MKKLKRIKKTVNRPDELDGHHGYGRACWGRPQMVYIFRRKANGASRFLKIGEYCAKCGGLHLYRAFKAGISYEAAKLIDAPDSKNPMGLVTKLAGRLHGGK